MSSTLTGAVAPAIIDLIADQEAPRAYLFEATPYDPAAGATETVRASIGLAHSVLDSNYWPSILKSAVDSNIDLYGDDEDQQGRASFGNIELLLGDGRDGHDAMIGYYWDSRPITIQLGGPDFDKADYVDVVAGTAESITYTKQKMGIVFRGMEHLLDADVQSNTYAGTGGLEGAETVKGAHKPLIYGQVWGVSPVAIDPANLIYQFHDGPANAVLNAWDGGLILDSQGDVADITTAEPGAGFYMTQLSGGYIKLGAPPAKQLTLDVQGDASAEGYRPNPVAIIRRILVDRIGLSESDLNLPSFNDARLDCQRASVGIVITNERANVVVTALIQSVGGSWTFDRLGKLKLDVIRLRRPAGTIGDNDIVSGSFFRNRTPSPSYKRRIGYQRMWTVLGEDQLSENIPESRKAFMSTEYRYAEFKDDGIKLVRAGARDRERETLIGNETDAQNMVDRQQAVFGKNTERFDVTLKRQQFKYQVGQTLHLEYRRFSIAVDCIILGIRENTASRQTSMRLLGVHPSVALQAESGSDLQTEDGQVIEF